MSAATLARSLRLAALTAYCEQHVASVRGWENDRGLSCDELGCMICNGLGDDLVEWWLDADETRDRDVPELPDVADMLAALADAVADAEATEAAT